MANGITDDEYRQIRLNDASDNIREVEKALLSLEIRIEKIEKAMELEMHAVVEKPKET